MTNLRIYSQGVGQAVAALDDVIAFVKYFSTFAFLTFSLGVESLSLCHFSDLSLGIVTVAQSLYISFALLKKTNRQNRRELFPYIEILLSSLLRVRQGVQRNLEESIDL